MNFHPKVPTTTAFFGVEDTVNAVEWVNTGLLFAIGAIAALAGLNFVGTAVGIGGATGLTDVTLIVNHMLPALLAVELTEALQIFLVHSFTSDPVLNLPLPVWTLAVDVVDIWWVRAVGVEAVKVLVLVVWYELVLSVTVEAVDIGQTASA
jgi:hypothetical protein